MMPQPTNEDRQAHKKLLASLNGKGCWRYGNKVQACVFSYGYTEWKALWLQKVNFY